jgi:cytochrome P450
MSEFLDIAALPSLEDLGFIAGRNSFRSFCRRIFQEAEPRYLRNEHGQLVVFRHADLQAFGIAPEIGNVPIGKLYPDRFTDTSGADKRPGWEIGKVIGNQVFTYNPPLHGPARRILTDWLSPKQVSLMEWVARETAGKIIDAAVDRHEIDFVSDIADALVVGFWSKLLHLTNEEQLAIGQCAHDMTRLFHVNRTPDDLRVLDQAFAEYSRILSVAADRGLANGDPIMTEIARKLSLLDFENDPFEVGMVPTSVGAVLAGNLVDGFHTTALATANTFHTLLENDQAYLAVRRSPELLPRAIAEALRLEPPVLLLSRYVLRDFHHDGLVIPAGNIITMLWAAGNHDPAAFPDPECFDMHRSHAGLTTFGKGIHICPGRYVGLMLVRILIEEFEANGVDLEAGGSPAEWYPSHKMGQLQTLPVRLARR